MSVSRQAERESPNERLQTTSRPQSFMGVTGVEAEAAASPAVLAPALPITEATGDAIEFPIKNKVATEVPTGI